MKNKAKLIVASLSALMVISGVSIAASHVVGGVTKANYTFEINGESVSLPSSLLVLSKDNTTYVPLRFLSETLGAKVGYKQGTIKISGLNQDLSNDENAMSDKEKADSALRELELFRKDNIELQKRIKELETSIDDKNLYRKLPAIAEDGAGLKINLRQVQKINSGDMRLDITISNSDKNNAFYLKPSKTALLINGKNYNADEYSSALLSTVAPAGESLGRSTYDGELTFKGAYESGTKGSITFYYSSNNNPNEKSMTIFFDLSK